MAVTALAAGCTVVLPGGQQVETPAPAQTLEREAAPEPTPSAAPPAADGGTLSAPGTRLAIGEPAVTHRQAGQKGDSYYGYAVLRSTVTQIERGDPAVFQKFENAADFEGLVPYYVRAEHVILSVEGSPNDVMTPLIRGRYSDGTEAGGVVSFGGGLRDVCGGDNFDELAVGEVATTCTVSLAEEGKQVVTGAQWAGDDRADGERDANPYYSNPVVWGD